MSLNLMIMKIVAERQLTKMSFAGGEMPDAAPAIDPGVAWGCG
jgi:hypothetical protein